MNSPETYDYALVAIPLIGLTLWAVTQFLGLPHSHSVIIACFALLPIVGHMLFVDPPVGPQRPIR